MGSHLVIAAATLVDGFANGADMGVDATGSAGKRNNTAVVPCFIPLSTLVLS